MSREQGLTVRDRVALLERDHPDLPLSRQTELLGVSRASAYYRPAGPSKCDLALMEEIDQLYTERPYYGSRRLAREISKRRKENVNRKCIQRLMGQMGLEAIYPKPNLSRNTAKHPIYPYLLRGVKIERPNQVWSTDITYIRLSHGFVYLVAVIDWYSRLVLAWRVSTTMEAGFCIEAAEEAIAMYGVPEIFNSDQGVQFTSADYIAIWETRGVRLSMDGRGRALDNIFVERLWRTVKYEEVYLKHYETVEEARTGLSAYFRFYNHERLHQSLHYLTPHEVHFPREG